MSNERIVPIKPSSSTTGFQAVSQAELEFASRQTVFVVQEGPGKVVAFSPLNSNRRTTIDVGEKPHEIEAAPDGKTVYVSNFGLLEVNNQIGTPGTTISVLDVRRGIERTRFELPRESRAPHGLKLRPPRYRELFTNAEAGAEAMIVFDTKSGRVLRTFSLPHGVHNFVFDGQGTAVFAFTIAGDIVRLDPEHGSILAAASATSPRGLGWTADHRGLIVGGSNELIFLDPIDLSVKGRAGNLGVGQIFYPTATPDGRWIFAPAVLDGVVLMIDTLTGSVDYRIETGSPLQVVTDGRRAWISNVLAPAELLPADSQPRMGGVVLLDLATLTAASVPDIPDANGIVIASPARKKGRI